MQRRLDDAMEARVLGKVDLEDLWWVGVLLSICGAVFGSLGDNLIKLSYTKEAIAVESGKEPTAIYCRYLWVLGMLCITVLNTSMTMAAYSFADASLTIPFAGLHICFNVLFARLLNSEMYTSRQLGFTFLILVGVSVVLTAGNHDTVYYTSEDISELFTDVGFIIMTVFLLIMISVQIPASLLHHDARVRCFAASSLVGTIAAFTQVNAKIVSESLTQVVQHGDKEEVFGSWVFYVALVVLVVAAFSQLFLLNKALKHYNAFVVVPIYNSFLIVLGSLYAAVLFKEYERFGLMSMILMPIGVVSTAVGVGLLSWDHQPEATHELGLGLPLRPSDSFGDIAMIPRSNSFAGYSVPQSPLFDEDFTANRSKSTSMTQLSSHQYRRGSSLPTTSSQSPPPMFNPVPTIDETNGQQQQEEGEEGEEQASLVPNTSSQDAASSSLTLQ